MISDQKQPTEFSQTQSMEMGTSSPAPDDGRSLAEQYGQVHRRISMDKPVCSLCGATDHEKRNSRVGSRSRAR